MPVPADEDGILHHWLGTDSVSELDDLLMADIFVDPETRVVQECFAVVQTTRRQRKRFPEGCVRIVESEAEAISAADAASKEVAPGSDLFTGAALILADPS